MTNLTNHARLWNTRVWLGGGWIARHEMVSVWVQESKIVTETGEQVKGQPLEVLGESGGLSRVPVEMCHQEAGGVWRDGSGLSALGPFPGTESVRSGGSQHELGAREHRAAGLHSPAGGPSALGRGAAACAPVLHLPGGLPFVSQQPHLLPLLPPRVGALCRADTSNLESDSDLPVFTANGHVNIL